MEHKRTISSNIFGDNTRIHQGDIINNNRGKTRQSSGQYFPSPLPTILLDSEDEARRCLADLRVTDPRDNKTRIENAKGGLLEDSYFWILSTEEYLRWREHPESGLFWIKGDPGKGKTMLLFGIINEMKKQTAKQPFLAYFLCQAGDHHINNALAVLRSLIFMLVVQQKSLISFVLDKYKHAGKRMFEDANAWVALSKILKEMLEDPSTKDVVLIIDGLDECVSDLDQLLELIVELSASRVKCLVSSRNWLNVQALEIASQKTILRLELKESAISDAVGKYIGHEVGELTSLKGYDDETRDAVHQHLSSNARNTFLWVSLVCERLRSGELRSWNTLTALKQFPLGWVLFTNG